MNNPPFSEELLADLYIKQELSLRLIAKRFNTDPTRIAYWMKRYGIKSRPAGTANLIGPKSPNWNGGHSIINGYWMVYTGTTGGQNRRKPRYEFEHRLVAEKILGRKLSRSEIIHHINGDRLNNKPSNLYLFQNNSLHKRIGHVCIPNPELKSNL